MLGLTNPETGILMLGVFVALILLGFPIAFTLMAMGVGFGYLVQGNTVFALLVQRVFSVMANDVLISVPLFIFMGYVIERAGILDRLFRSLQLAAGFLPASLALATLATCALFATATGIVGAVVTLMGLLAFPAMLRAGYDKRLAAGVVCAGGCLGILIPPSIMLILYGATASVSVPRLYAGAFFPGFMLAGLYMIYVLGRALLNPRLAPKLPAEERDVPTTKVVLMMLTSFMPLALLIMAVLGAILFGWSTPSEAAALGVLGSLLLAGFYRWLKSVDEHGIKRPYAIVPYGLLLAAAVVAAATGWATVLQAATFTLLGGFVLLGFYRILEHAEFNAKRTGRVFNVLAHTLFPALLIGTVIVTIVLPLAVLSSEWRGIIQEPRSLPILKQTFAVTDGLGITAVDQALVLQAVIFGALGLAVCWVIFRALKVVSRGGFGGASVFLLFAHISPTWTALKDSVFLTARTSAMVCWLFVGAYIFSSVFSLLGGHEPVENLFKALNLNTVTFLILTQLIIFLLGWPLEWTEIILIFVPIFLPLLKTFNVDPLFFGVLIALNIQTSFMTPPMAMAIYYLKGVAPPGVSLNDIVMGALPFVGMVIVSMVLLYTFPVIGTWLPHYLFD